MEEMKQCPACFEEINAKATKCPHCQSWQSKWRFDHSNIKHQLIFISFIFGLLAFFYFSAFGSLINQKSFYESKDLINVSNTNLNYSIKECGARISIIGTITNNSDTIWKDVHFEAQFYDKDNKLIDTFSDNNYDLVLLNNDKSAFKITGSADKPESSYVHHKIIIKSAREGGGLF